VNIIAPFPPAAAPDRRALFELAEGRWDAIFAGNPDLEPALVLQKRLLTVVIDAACAVAARPLLLPSLPPRHLAAKMSRGVPLLSGEAIPPPVETIREPLLQLCVELAAGGAGDAAEHIRAAIADGNINAGSLMTASLSRDKHAIREGAVHRGLAPDLLWLVAELAMSAFANALQRALLPSPAADEALRQALDAWPWGYCAACGSWPALSEVHDGHRMLGCSFCGRWWELRSYACIYCGEAGEAFVTAAPNEERKDRRIEICGNCGGYLKTVTVGQLSPFPLLAIRDLETMDLDVAAMDRGYRRPNLKEFPP
jgi:FdhE protein